MNIREDIYKFFFVFDSGWLKASRPIPKVFEASKLIIIIKHAEVFVSVRIRKF